MTAIPRSDAPGCHALVRKVLEDDLFMEIDDDYEWCRFCEAGVYLGGMAEPEVVHDSACVLVRAADELGIAGP